MSFAKVCARPLAMSFVFEVITLPALQDNYVHLIHHIPTHQVLVIDPSLAAPVKSYLESRGWQLSLILNTHHHWDHTGGNLELKEWAHCPIWCSDYDFKEKRVEAADRGLSAGAFEWQGLKLQAIAVPGHTLGHMVYFASDPAWLFSGDTLFLMGCGRLFEGTPAQLLESLDRLARLPNETLVYCGHDYIEKNARFALEVEPNNEAVQKRIHAIQTLKTQGQPTQPAAIALEKETNPFLRVRGATPETRVRKFTNLRERRNHF
jgi:hydroxyacylglutathione hydrolase